MVPIILMDPFLTKVPFLGRSPSQGVFLWMETLVQSTWDLLAATTPGMSSGLLGQGCGLARPLMVPLVPVVHVMAVEVLVPIKPLAELEPFLACVTIVACPSAGRRSQEGERWFLGWESGTERVP